MSVFSTPCGAVVVGARDVGVAPFAVTNADRSWFLRCRRAWDWSALARGGLEPVEDDGDDALVTAVRDALAVYYFPGMWSWDRSIVAPLVTAAAPALDRFLEAFANWARSVDRFTPLRVAADVDVVVPDPVIPGRALATERGEAVRYRERIDLVTVSDEDQRCWLVEHHVVSEWADADAFALNDQAILACWAWHEHELSMDVAGVHHNELRLDPPAFRRTVVEYSDEEQTAAAMRLGRTVLAMLDAGLVIDPNPDWDHCCSRCAFRAPCIARNRGDEEQSSVLLRANYRRRSAEVLEEGRLGGASWSTGRGAAPFGSRRL